MTSERAAPGFLVGLRAEMLSGRHLPPILAQALDEAKLPPRIWACGNTALATTKTRVAVAGSRQADDWALSAIEWIGHHLAEAGACIVSGGAIGSDCAAHAGALKAGGCTIVIPPIPLTDLDPRTWRPELARLWNRKRTLFLSLLSPGERPSKSDPILRNRLMAALGQASVAGQTRIQSGTNHFLATSRELRRPVFLLKQPRVAAPLRAALKTLERQGAVPFAAEEAASPDLARKIVEAASRYEDQRASTARSQTLLFGNDA